MKQRAAYPTPALEKSTLLEDEKSRTARAAEWFLHIIRDGGEAGYRPRGLVIEMNQRSSPAMPRPTGRFAWLKAIIFQQLKA
jgi:hypothetical protein